MKRIGNVLVLLVVVAVVIAGTLWVSSVITNMKSAETDQNAHTSTYGVTGSALTVHEGEKTFNGEIAAPPVKLNGICIIQVKPAEAKDDAQSYQALMACANQPTKGDKVRIKDYVISMPHHLPDMVHIAEKITP